MYIEREGEGEEQEQVIYHGADREGRALKRRRKDVRR